MASDGSSGFRVIDGGIGLLIVGLDDKSNPGFPEGWAPMDDEPLYIEGSGVEVWVCGRV